MPIAALSSKGQIVIPVELRHRADLNTGDRVLIDFDEATQELRLRKAESVGQQIDRLSVKVASWIEPGTPPVADPREFYRSRAPRA